MTATKTAPRVKLGHLADDGIAPSLYGLIERGAMKRPKLARELRGTMEIRFSEPYPPVRVRFGDEEILVEDAHDDGVAPDVVISGSLPEVVHLASAPLMGGLPKPTHARGRSALMKVAGGKVRIVGSRGLARRVLKLLQI